MTKTQVGPYTTGLVRVMTVGTVTVEWALNAGFGRAPSAKARHPHPRSCTLATLPPEIAMATKQLTLQAAEALAVSQASSPMDMDRDRLGLQVIQVGTLNGTIHLQGSLDGLVWSNLQDAEGEDIVVCTLDGNAYNRTHWFSGLGGKIRTNFTRASGTGNLTVKAEG